MPEPAIDREGIAATERTIRPYVRFTPTVVVPGSDFGIGETELALKLELTQRAGSFKARGAFANLLLRPTPAAGIAAASGGNHGAAVAWAAMTLGKAARIFVPTVASDAKVERIRRSGAELVVTGDRYADALAACEAWVEESGALSVHAFDQAETILGAGTVGLELERQCPRLDTLLVPVGGGGLIGGVGAWYSGRAAVVGVEPEAAPTLTQALAAGRPVDAEDGGIAADSLAPRRVGALTLALAQRNVNQVVLVAEEAIRRAQAALWEVLRLVAEPGGAAALAALLSRRYVPRAGERIGVVVSGGNTTAVDFNR